MKMRTVRGKWFDTCGCILRVRRVKRGVYHAVWDASACGWGDYNQKIPELVNVTADEIRAYVTSYNEIRDGNSILVRAWYGVSKGEIALFGLAVAFLFWLGYTIGLYLFH